MSTCLIARRVALLSSSSLGLAAVVSAASLGAALMPAPAAAQATCTATTTITGNGTNTVTIAGGTSNPGITCNYIGDNATVSTLGAITVSSSGGVPADPLVNGVNLRATGTDDIRWVSTAGTVTGSTQTNGPVIDARTAGGNITINTAGVTGTSATVTHGIFADSSAGGLVSITTTGTVSGSNSTSGVAGIQARSIGGGVDITTGGTVNGNQYGILAQTTGSGALTVTSNATVSVGANGVAAVDIATGTGPLIYNKEGNATVSASGSNGIAVRITTQGGNAVLNRLGNGSITAGPSGYNPANTHTAVEVDMAGGLTTINNTATSGSFGGSNPLQRSHGLLRASGDGAIVFNNTGSALYGVFDLSDFDGDFTLTNDVGANGWATHGLSVFAGGDDTIVNTANGVMILGSSSVPGFTGGTGSNGILGISAGAVTTTALRFGGGDDLFENAGTLVVSLKSTGDANRKVLGAILNLEGLETFNNSGDILLGGQSGESNNGGNANVGLVITDGDWDDMIVMRDGHWNGQDGSRIFIDAFFNGTGQASCTRLNDIPENVEIPISNIRAGHFAANDCLDFQGSQVSGQTLVVVNNALPGDRGAYNPRGNVVVDARGGIVDSPDAFVLSPDTPGYNAETGVIDQGLFVYALGFDAEEDGEGGRFMLYGLESPVVQQFPLVAHAANELWRGTTAGWIDRRGEQRAEGELQTGLWMRGRATSADRTSVNIVMAGDTPLTFDNSFTQDDRSLTVGLDFGGDAFGGAEWVAGAMFGYTRSMLSYEESPNVADLEGAHAGFYAGFTAGGFFQDLVINGTWLEMDNDAPSLNLQPVGTVLSTAVQTIGGQFETGWRFAFGPMSVEPLASVTWLKTTFDDLNVPADDPTRLGGDVSFDDSRSLRAGLGVRVGMSDIAPRLLPVGFTVTAKAMEEWDGESTVRVVNVGPDPAVVTNTFDGTFSELSAALTFGDSSHVTGFVSVGGLWGDDYKAQTGSLGVRLTW